MVELTVYGSAKATCTQRILILLEELDLKYNFEEIDLGAGEQKEQEFMAMNPFGKVPVVKYGEKTLFESRAILRYIARNNQEVEDLYPDVNTDIWMEVEAQSFNPSISKIVYEKTFKKWKGMEADEDRVRECLSELEGVLDIYEEQLKKREYIGGDSYTIADIAHIPYAYYFLKAGYKNVLKKRPRVYSWLKKIVQRPVVRRVLGGELN
jgi:glutathione S-transferase